MLLCKQKSFVARNLHKSYTLSSAFAFIKANCPLRWSDDVPRPSTPLPDPPAGENEDLEKMVAPYNTDEKAHPTPVPPPPVPPRHNEVDEMYPPKNELSPAPSILHLLASLHRVTIDSSRKRKSGEVYIKASADLSKRPSASLERL